MEKKELKKELFEKYNWDRFFTEKVKEDVWEWVEDKLDKAREEGREEGINAVLFPKFKRDKNGTLKREGWVNTSKLKDNK